MKRTFKMYLCWRKWKSADIALELIGYKASNDSSGMWTAGVIAEVDVDVEVPDDFDPRAVQIEALKLERQQVTARLQSEITRIDHEIGKLLALEHKEKA